MDTLVVPAGATMIGNTSSMRRGALAPILLTIFTLFGRSSRVSTGTFQIFVVGKIGQPPTEGCASAKHVDANRVMMSFIGFTLCNWLPGGRPGNTGLVGHRQRRWCEARHFSLPAYCRAVGFLQRASGSFWCLFPTPCGKHIRRV